jgi:hypothetical protein
MLPCAEDTSPDIKVFKLVVPIDKAREAIGKLKVVIVISYVNIIDRK